MSNFINVPIKERIEGVPGVVAEEEFNIYIDSDKITVFNGAKENANITIVRMVCGAVLCVMMSLDKFKRKLMDTGSKVIEQEKTAKVKARKK